MQTQTPITITGNEATILHALRRIVTETMAYPPVRPHSADSYLPTEIIETAQRALAIYGMQVEPSALAQGGAA